MLPCGFRGASFRCSGSQGSGVGSSRGSNAAVFG